MSGAKTEQQTELRDGPMGRLHAPVGAGASKEARPGLVFIHDVWGPSEHSQALASDLAAEGFAVLEINLYRAMGDFEITDPGEQIRSLSDPDVLADLDAGADWLRAQPACGGRKVGVVGVCMGGTYALLAASASDRFAAAAPFYGVLSYDEGMLASPTGRDATRKPVSPIEAAPRLRMPMLASFGAEDAFVPLEQVAELERALGDSPEFFEIDRYPGAGHAFLNRTRPEAYHADASGIAWQRVIPFLRERLA